ncbi:MAG TPA: hypothetical protein DHN33_00015 [Eubacteriaceae bacterium]|nr:hypothetical protein [Eubacteriaceae bacterium]
MRRLHFTDVFSLFFIGFAFLMITDAASLTIEVLLVSVILFGLMLYFENEKVIGLISGLFLIVCFYDINFAYFFPGVFYRIFGTKPFWLSYLLFFGIILHTFENNMVLAFVISLCFTASLLKVRTDQNIQRQKKYLTLSDSYRNLKYESKKQKQAILQKQDGEIRAAMLKERNRIAREIHDNVGHLLSSALLQVGALQAIASEQKELTSLKQTLDRAMDNIRESVHNLHDESVNLKMGAKGYLLKQKYESIIPALKIVQTGQTIYGDEIMGTVPSLLAKDKCTNSTEEKLTEREQQILYQIAQGFSNKEIAQILYLSEGTVRNYISTILEKLDLRDRTQLAVYYYKQL